MAWCACASGWRFLSMGWKFDTMHGAGIAFQLDIEDAVGLVTQMPVIQEELEYDLIDPAP